ncbi:nitrate- and nitrite sensing domain-containing protein [Micromonospora sp. WMMD1128]|uniref:sensor histidine kinase n=1 Tax=Micromonospora sp. WMMD1128 TaxID=3015150 RepID=UPI00248B44BC|nr:nitrate- and nitrite sensing domain-containing protein [Micromonospora sp. WMMD1128]WBB75599.1 nitrate- and nitrite sensing domain-containing protein [Micromonospora sp. WMMD1128]
MEPLPDVVERIEEASVGARPDPARGVAPAPHRRRSGFRLRDWRMGTKLATVLVIPTLAFLVLAGVQTRSLVGTTTTLSDFADQVGIGRQITTVIDRIQQERDRSAGELAALRRAGAGADRDAAVVALRPFQEATDRAMDELRTVAAPLADADAAWRIAYSEALEAYDQVVAIRAAVPAALLASDTILSNYHRSVAALISLLAEPSPGGDRQELTEAVLRYVQLARVKELSSRIRGELYAAARSGRYTSDNQVTLSDLRAQQLTALGAFRVAATDEQIRRYDRTSVDPAFVAAARLEERTLPVGDAKPALPSATLWWAATEQRQALFGQLEGEIVDDAGRRADDASARQLRETLLVAGGIVTVLLVAVLISLLVGRSVARAIRQLRGQALRIAQVELPMTLERLRAVDRPVGAIAVPPAVIKSQDEIGELAEAFVAVHRSAVGVAVEQATMRQNVNAMFVNLARRSQVLVERQLELLDDLEREESDPDQLENLFKLDHLAARMRRNDESLLVLAGTESTRRWNRPVGLGAVLLAASAEIEQYQRIRHESHADLHVVGHAVGDLVHLFAELLENATAFSRPETAVRVVVRADGPGALVEIIDQGLGMGPAALAEANAVLAEPPAADVGASERMGLFVVSHLGARHGVWVQLRPGREGLVTRVRIPAGLLAEASAPDLDPPMPARTLTGEVAVGSRTFGVATAELPVAGRHPAAPQMATAQMAPPGAPSLPVSPLTGRPLGDATEGGPTGPPAPAGPPGAVPRHRPAPGRAEHVLAPAAGPAAGGGWFSRQGPTSSVLGVTPAPAPTPVTGGTNARGLPVRVPMAQLAAVSPADRPDRAAVRHEPDPEAVGGMLSRFYGGVRRAETEETTEMYLPQDQGGRRQ